MSRLVTLIYILLGALLAGYCLFVEFNMWVYGIALILGIIGFLRSAKQVLHI